MIKFIVEGRPVPHVRMTQRGKFVKQNAARYIGYKQMVGLIAKRYFKKPSDKPIKIVVDVYLWGKTTPMGMDGDVSNFLKTAEDALNRIAYEDDRQIVKATATKQPCPSRVDERMEITIEELVG
jgi:crossover junction endodeoxyribonuclease RusA